MNTNKSKEIFEKAKKSIPGGVNSPVRAFQSVKKDYPIFQGSLFIIYSNPFKI